MSEMKIMIIDDSNTVRKTMAAFLKNTDYTLIEATDGIVGLMSAFEEKPSILFIDVMMPRLNGHELCETIKSQPWGKDIYICMLTGRDTLLDRAKAINSKADYMLTKPFKADEIKSLISKVKEGKKEFFGLY